jgi:hypothetical protein
LCRFARMKSKTSAKKTKMPAARAKAKPAGKPAARKAAAKAPAKAAAKGPAAKPRVAASPKVAPYTPKPIEGIGWAPFRYSP